MGSGMPPNPDLMVVVKSCVGTPDSVADDKENISNKGGLKVTKMSNHPQTEPRARNPLQARDTNRVTPKDIISKPSTKSSSEPIPLKKKATIPLQIVEDSKSTMLDSSSVGVKRPAPDLANQKQRKKKLLDQNWAYSNDKEGVLALIQKLSLNLTDKDQVETPLELFRYLEKSGELNTKALKVFSVCPGIETLLMGPTFGVKVNEFGLTEEGKYPPHSCTIPLFTGFTKLRVLDLTCVPITDEDVRYLIKLKNLLALGLSGTRITGRAIKYLGKHGEFAKTLQCLKLCHLEKLDDVGLLETLNFNSLKELDLFGCSKITLKGCLCMIPLEIPKCTLLSVRLPEQIQSIIQERHLNYIGIGKKNPDLFMDLDKIDELSMGDLKLQLRLHQKTYSDIFLNLEMTSLCEKLKEILICRRREEFLWSIS